MDMAVADLYHIDPGSLHRQTYHIVGSPGADHLAAGSGRGPCGPADTGGGLLFLAEAGPPHPAPAVGRLPG